MVIPSPRPLAATAFVSFAAFGAFWGVWGGSVPRIQQQAGVSDGELGFALLFVGAAALPAMLLAGRALDRWGPPVAAGLIGALGPVGAGLALTAVDLPRLCVGLALVGAVSGAADVAINSLAGQAEKLTARPVISRSHGVFSSLVVLASLLAGLAATVSLPASLPFIVVAAFSLAAGLLLHRNLTPRRRLAPPPDADPGYRPEAGTPAAMPLLLIGVLGAFAFASENAHQSWSAVFFHHELGAGAGLAAVAPAIFAATVAVTRFAAGGLTIAYPRWVLLTGASAAVVGATVIAVAPTLVVAALGLALAAAGTAVLFPTVLGIVSRSVDEARRGRATSLVTTVSYLGFVLSPGYVGLWAGAVGLRGAMIAVAALAVVLVALTPLLLRLSGLNQQPSTSGRKRPAEHVPAPGSLTRDRR